MKYDMLIGEKISDEENLKPTDYMDDNVSFRKICNTTKMLDA